MNPDYAELAVRPDHPTVAVIASRNRPYLLSDLCAALDAQETRCLVYDNGYQEIARFDWSPRVIKAHDWPLHRMWNEGLFDAAHIASAHALAHHRDDTTHNVLIINDDVMIAPHFVAYLERALRSDDNIDVAFPGDGKTPVGWAFMLRGEAGWRFDEDFEWWYGDTDLFRRVHDAGRVITSCPDARAIHLDPARSTLENPIRLAQARADEARYADKWGWDPAEMWLAVNHPAP